MIKRRLTWTALAFFTLFAGVCSAITDSATGKSFPDTVSFEGNNLKATGVTTRKKFFIKVYSIAHYMQDPERGSGDVYNNIINSNKAKQFTLDYARDVDESRTRKGWKDAFARTAPSGLQSEIDQFINYVPSTKKNDKLVLRSLPNGTVVVIVNGREKGRISNNPRFARAVWAIWFGNGTPVKRNELISKIQ